MKNIGKKARALIIVGVMLLSALSGCGNKNKGEFSVLSEGQSDLEYVQSKRTLVVGITEFAPMDFYTRDNLTGFDFDLAKGFAKSIGVEAEFKEIDWDDKINLLENGNIDCIWNGMTMTDKLQSTISCSEPYLSNAQVVVQRKDDMEKYKTMESCQHLLFAVEAGSTGESLLKELKYRYTAYDTQMEALQSVSTKQADAAVVDIIMAGYYTIEEQEFNDLDFKISLSDEKICAGFRKNSGLAEKANEFLKASYEDGTIINLADHYGIGNAVLDK